MTSDTHGEPRFTSKQEDLIRRLETEVMSRLKWRFWIGALVVALLGFFGVREMLRGFVDTEVKAAQRAAILAEESAKKATTATDEASKQTQSYIKTVETLQGEAQKVDAQFVAVRQRITADAKNAALRSEKDFSAAQQRLAALEALVKQIGEENEVTRRATADYAKKVATLENRIEREQKRFAENSAYTVWISFIPDKKSLALDIQSRLASAGFKAPLTEITSKILEASKGTTLTYLAAGESKAQEVLAVVKSILKDVQTKKLPDADPTKLRFSKEHSLLFGFWGLYAEPTTIYLTLGTQ